jgi:hypothetical protein
MGNPYNAGGFGGNAAGGRTPFANSGRTPNPYAEGRTPGWNASRTPNPYVDGGKTPAWNASSRTPNPYADGSKTPAWNASSRTPNPYNSGGGASSWGGATPGRNVAPTGGSSWGGATPGRANAGWGTTDGWASPKNTGWGATESTPWVSLSDSSFFHLDGLFIHLNRVHLPLFQLLHPRRQPRQHSIVDLRRRPCILLLLCLSLHLLRTIGLGNQLPHHSQASLMELAQAHPSTVRLPLKFFCTMQLTNILLF